MTYPKAVAGSTTLKSAQDRAAAYRPKNTPNSPIPSQIVGLASPRRSSETIAGPPSWLAALISRIPLSLFRFMCYTVPPRTGGTHYGRFTVCRCAVSPDGVAGFHQPDARGVSDLDPTL